MAISAAKLEANRRNARKSTGPRTEKGKERSRLNAVTHGLRAETLVLLDEDPQALETRKKAWRASLLPQDDVEQSAVDDAVEYAWLRDRARRAQAARLATNIASAGVDQAIREADEVLRLGQKLFSDNRGPLAAYPHIDIEKDLSDKRVSHSELVDDPEDPPRLVLHLQSTAGGCQWMLDQWSELKSILSEGLNWQSADKLKAVRLLGRQPIEAVDDRTVLKIFLACLTIEGKPNTIIPEIWNELSIHERKPYERRLAGRGIDRLTPESAEAARRVLFEIIERESARIELKAAAHRRRAEVVDALAAECLLFDDSPEGERMRRFELACGRGIWRSLESLRKIRQVTNGPLPVVRGPLPVAEATIEALDECENTNEPTSERLRNEDGERKNAPNEAIPAGENATNEPTSEKPGKEDGERKNAPNEAIAAGENATNEPTSERRRKKDGRRKKAPNEAIAAWDNEMELSEECGAESEEIEKAMIEAIAAWDDEPGLSGECGAESDEIEKAMIEAIAAWDDEPGLSGEWGVESGEIERRRDRRPPSYVVPASELAYHDRVST